MSTSGNWSPRPCAPQPLADFAEPARYHRATGAFHIDTQGARLARLARYHIAHYDTNPAEAAVAVWVPGRVELLGKHVDYAGGTSLTAALPLGIAFVATPIPEKALHVVDVGRQTDVRLGVCSPMGTGWTKYVYAVWQRLLRNTGEPHYGIRIAFESTLPPSAGMSSSSALVTGIWLALSALYGVHRHPVMQRAIENTADLADYLGCLENGRPYKHLAGREGVGTFGGSQDHAAIVLGRARHASCVSYAPLSVNRYVPWDPHLSLVVANSGVRATKTGNAKRRYNLVSMRARALAAALAGTSYADAPTLREALRMHDATLVDRLSDVTTFAALQPIAFAPQTSTALDHATSLLCEALDERPHEARRRRERRRLETRLRAYLIETHVHVPQAVEALAWGDGKRFGQIALASHTLARRQLGNQVAETNALVSLAQAAGAYGASAFGAGFGGAVWAVVDAAVSADFVAAWQAAYHDGFPEHAPRTWFGITHVAEGASILDVSWAALGLETA